MRKINWKKYRIHRCKSRHICEICGKVISRGERYYNTGIKQAHTSCVEFIDPEQDTAQNLEEELFIKDFKPTEKPCYQGPRGFVHVFNPGECTCNCGERSSDSRKSKHVGNIFLYGASTKTGGIANYAD